MIYIILLFFIIVRLHIVWTIEFLYMTSDWKMFMLKYQLYIYIYDIIIIYIYFTFYILNIYILQYIYFNFDFICKI